MELGEQIANLREARNLTQVELAEKARISPSTLSQVESGRVPRPHVGTVRKLARALGVEPAELRKASPEEPATRPKGRAPLPRNGGAGDQSLRYVRAWRSVLWTLALHWGESAPQSSREIVPLLSAINSLVDAGVFEDPNADTSLQGELSLLRLALRKLAEISDAVEDAEVAAEMRGSLALVPDLRDNVA